MLGSAAIGDAMMSFRNMAFATSVMFVCLAPVTAIAKDSSSVNRPENREVYASIGDVLVKVTLRESLPNLFGKPDIFGRKRDRGFVEIRYMGLTDNGRAVFRRRTVDIYSNETTMSRSNIRYGTGTVTAAGNTAYVSTMSTGAAPATVQALPPDTIETVMDLAQNRLMTVDNRLIEILSADSGGVRFVVRKQ
jgi:hypothetical protein